MAIPGVLRRCLGALVLGALHVLATAPAAHAAGTAGNCANPVRGINLVQLPTGWRNGKVELQFPGQEHVKYYADVGFNAIRLPITWEELQPELQGPLSSRYLDQIVDFLDKAEARKLPVLVELHNYDRYRNQLIGSEAVPLSAFQDVWRRLAAALKGHPAVYAYGLMNEPHHTNRTWQSTAQYGVDGVREADRKHQIYVAGDDFSNAQLWPRIHPKPFVVDPENKIVYEAHMYLDDDFSGRYQIPLSASVDLKARVQTRLQPFIDWLNSHHQRGAIGEMGVPADDPRWLAGLEAFWDLADANCVEWFLWAGGRWRPTYELNLEPTKDGDKPQIRLLREWLVARKKGVAR